MAKNSPTSERTYLGFADNFSVDGGKTFIRKGEKVTLSDDQYEALTRGGHSFDPAWTAGIAVVRAPHEVPDMPGSERPARAADTDNQTNV